MLSESIILEKTRMVSPGEYLKSLMGADDCELTINRCLAGNIGSWDSGSRCLQDTVIWLIDSGEIADRINGKGVHLRPGSFHIMWPGVPHNLRSVPSAGFLRNFSLRYELRSKGKLLRLQPDTIHQIQGSDYAFWLRSINLESFGNKRFQSVIVRSLLAGLLAQVFSRPDTDSSRRGGQGFSLGDERALVEFAENRLGEDIQPRDLAGVLRLSPPYFARKFRQHFGLSPRAWINRERLNRAAGLLIDSRYSIKEIAAMTGFVDQRFFSLQFRRQYGCTPTAYRNRGS